MIKTNVIKKILIISLLLHVFAAIFSSGFHHFDEHFQVFEFLALKFGQTTANQLPWEFREQIRPWFQPFTYGVLVKCLNFLGITSAITTATIIRIFTSLLGWFSLVTIGKTIRPWFKTAEGHLCAIILLHFSWFIPYIHARTSSENFALIFYSLSFAFMFRDSNLIRNGLAAGFIWGLSYLSRFQMIFAIAPLWFWFLIFKRQKSFLISSGIGVIIAIFLGVLIDSWGYGQLTFTLWNYFRANFMEGAMQATGNSYPFYWYLRWSFLRGIPPISLFFIFGLIYLWVKKWRHPLTWMTLPFFIFHSLVSHKEMRFIFFLCALAPIALALLIEEYRQRSLEYKKFLIFVLILNFIFLIFAAFRPANPAINFYSFMYTHPEIKIITAYDENPYTMLGLNLNYYKSDMPELQITTAQNPNFLELPKGYNFFTKGEWMIEAKKNSKCELVYSAYPHWIIGFNYFNWVKKSRFWSLFYCS